MHFQYPRCCKSLDNVATEMEAPKSSHSASSASICEKCKCQKNTERHHNKQQNKTTVRIISLCWRFAFVVTMLLLFLECAVSNCEVFLGGSCNPTTWRTDTAIPELKKQGITFYNPVSFN